MKKAIGDIKTNVVNWGVSAVWTYSFTSGAMYWNNVNTKKKYKLEQDMKNIAAKVQKRAGTIGSSSTNSRLDSTITNTSLSVGKASLASKNPLAGFSVCGGLLSATYSVLPQCNPRGAFLSYNSIIHAFPVIYHPKGSLQPCHLPQSHLYPKAELCYRLALSYLNHEMQSILNDEIHLES